MTPPGDGRQGDAVNGYEPVLELLTTEQNNQYFDHQHYADHECTNQCPLNPMWRISVCGWNAGYHADMAGPCLDTLVEAQAYRRVQDDRHLKVRSHV